MYARRDARDYERLPQHSEAHLNWALITMMTRRLTRKSPGTDWTKRQTTSGGDNLLTWAHLVRKWARGLMCQSKVCVSSLRLGE